MAKWRNFREEIEEEFAEFRHHHETKAESQRLMLSLIESCEVEQVRNHLARGLDLNFCNRYGESPLHIATKQLSKPGSEEMFELLIYFGAPLERSDRFGITALHSASQVAPRAVSLLLDAGAPVNSQDNAGRTALMLACESESPGALVIVQNLLDRGANVNSKDEDGKTALHYICCNSKCQEAVRSEIVYRLLYAGAPVNAKCNRGGTPLYEASCLLIVATLRQSPTPITNLNFDVYCALVRAGASVKCFENLWVLFYRHDEFFLKMLDIIKPVTSVSQMKQLIKSAKSCSRVNVLDLETFVLEPLRKSSRMVRTLKCACRGVVRTTLLERANAGNVFPYVDKLNIPKYLEEYLTDITSQ